MTRKKKLLRNTGDVSKLENLLIDTGKKIEKKEPVKKATINCAPFTDKEIQDKIEKLHQQYIWQHTFRRIW